MQRFIGLVKRSVVVLGFTAVAVLGSSARGEIISIGGLTSVAGLSVHPEDGAWDSGNVTFAWYVQRLPASDAVDIGEENPAFVYRYSYYISVGEGPQIPGLSHLMVTVTEDFGYDHFFDNFHVETMESGTWSTEEPDNYTVTLGPTYQTEITHAVKVDTGPNGSDFSNPVVFTFDSYNAPVWGDVYGTGGSDQGIGNRHSFWNSGLGESHPELDVFSFNDGDSELIDFGPYLDLGEPVEVYLDQQVDQQVGGVFKIVRPNGPHLTPEPGFFAAMLGMGLMGGLIHGVRRKRRSAGQPTN